MEPAAPSRRTEEKRYLREVERHFLRRRGHPLLISPRDWALALSWFEEGIPLSAVLAGIDEVFDRAPAASPASDLSPPPARRPRTLAYCARAVEGLWHERRGRLLLRAEPAAGDRSPGAPEHGAGEHREPGEMDRARLAARIEEACGRLVAAGATLGGEATAWDACRSALAGAGAALRQGSASSESVEQVIAHADAEAGRLLLASCDPADREAAAREAEERLAPHRPHMTASAWRRTLDRAIENRLRERHHLPRLSLLLL